MSAIRQLIVRSKIPKVYFISSRSASVWNKEWMPGPYPKTPEERAAAAKKYNLLPEEYEPDPEGFGDYPKLPDISGASKDPYYNWDNPEHKRDYNETIHVHGNIISEDRWDIHGEEKEFDPPGKQMIMFFGTMLAIFIPYYYCHSEGIRFSLPHMKKQLAAEGPHYKYPQ